MPIQNGLIMVDQTMSARIVVLSFGFKRELKVLRIYRKEKIVYNLCCSSNKICLEQYKKPPAPLADLLRFDGDARSK
jgi:hypothetical protein